MIISILIPILLFLIILTSKQTDTDTDRDISLSNRSIIGSNQYYYIGTTLLLPNFRLITIELTSPIFASKQCIFEFFFKSNECHHQ